MIDGMTDIWRGTTTLITGASRGLGAAFAQALSGRGTHLVLVARTATQLEAVAAQLHGVPVTILPADLADPAAPAALIRDLEARGLVVDHLINNAGVGPQGRFQDLDLAAHLTTIDVNVRAATELTARLLPAMVARRCGGVLNIASTAAYQGLQWVPVYSGSKAYVVNWSEGVWVGLRGSGVRCCCCSPGPVDTPFFRFNGFTAPPSTWMRQSPEAAVRRAIRAYEHDACHVLPFLPFRLLAWSTRLIPRAMAARLGGWYGAPQV
jgi:hypothetical protein